MIWSEHEETFSALHLTCTVLTLSRHIAARQNHTDAVVLLLARGAQLDIVNTKGQTPMDCAVPDSDVYLQLTLNSKVLDMMKQNNIRTEKILSRYSLPFT